MKKMFTKVVILLLLLAGNVTVKAWPGYPLPALHVNGRNLQDPCGNNVVLHGVAVTPHPWFNGCQYGFDSQYCTWDNYDVEGCLAYNKAVINRLTDTSDGWYLNYIRLHIDPYWSNTPGVSVSGEDDISAFSYSRFVTYVDQVIIPLINHARDRGMYVILRPPGVCPHRIAVGDNYHNYLKTIWSYLSQHSAIRNADNIMFELANEPVEILGTNGNWGSIGDEHFASLKNFFQPIVDIIRNNGANNICWIPGTGWQSHYQGYVSHRITGGNIGYAVHIYPGYWGGLDNYTKFKSGWDINVKPVADIAPIVVTETDWAPTGYGTFGTGVTGTAGGDGFGANFNHITYNSGNVSWNVLSFDNLLDHGAANGAVAYDGDWQACAAPVKHWFEGFADENLPLSSCGGGSSAALVDSAIYEIAFSTDETKVLDLQYGDDSNGGVLRPYTSNDGTAQQWQAVNDGNGYWSFVSVASGSGRCVDLVDGTTTNGTSIRLWEYNGSDAQKWQVADAGNGYYKIVSKANTSKSWDVANCVVDGSAELQLWDYFGSSCQLFKFNLVQSSSQGLVDGAIYEIEFSTDNTKVLDLEYGDDSNGGVLRPYTRNNATAQQWIAVDVGNGYWRFRSNASATGRVIDLASGSTSNGASIQLWDSYSNDAQTWQVVDAGNGYYKILSKLDTSKGWDVANCVVDGSEPLQLWDSYGTSCQLFRFNYIGLKSASIEPLFEEDVASSYQIYPNPTPNGSFILSLPVEGCQEVLSIYTMDGSLVYEQRGLSSGENKVKTGLKTGFYLVKVSGYSFAKKIIIK